MLVLPLDQPLRRIGAPQKLGSTTAIAGYLEISGGTLAAVRQAGALPGLVLWAPVMSVAA